MSDGETGGETESRPDREALLGRYETIVNTVDDGIYQLDLDGRFVAANDVIVDITGYSREELLGEHVSLIMDERDVTAFAADVREMIRDPTADVKTRESSMDTAAGTELPVEVRFTLLRENSSVVGTVGVVRDISGRRERERQLEREHNLTQQILEASPTVVGLFDAETHELLRANAEAVAFLDAGGETPDGYEYTGGDVPLFDEDDTPVPPEERPFARAIETGEPVYDSLYRMERSDGERWWFSINAVPIHQDGRVERVVVVGDDVTLLREQARQLERQRDELKSELEAVFARVTDAVFALDDEWRFTHVNERAEEIFGGTEEALLGAVIWEAFPGIVGTRFQAEYEHAMESQGTVTFEEYFAPFDRWYEVAAYPSESGLSVYFRDVTERKEYQRKLEESNELLEQFAYAASHDLREPLRTISNYLRLIERRYGDALDETGHEFLEFAVDSADRMHEMILGLLEYSRIETGGDALEPTDMGSVLEHVRDALELRIEECDAEITADSLPRVQGDANQLRQVVQNLLSNALKYAGDAPPRVHVSAERDGPNWVISISDEGIGIDPDDADRIFGVFQRLHTRQECEGTGIGLALCERIVERHGGEIWVESETGEGATFSFSLPAVREPDTDGHPSGE